MWLDAAASGATPDPLLQYGAIGFVLILAIAGIRVLYKRETDAHDAEKARADRLEKEVERLNELFRTHYASALEAANKALQDAATQMNKARRRGAPAHRGEDDDR